MINRMNTYRLNNEKKGTELQTIEQILDNNGYDSSIIEQFSKPRQKDNSNNTKDSWAKFTYFEEKQELSPNFSKKHGYG